jgi:type I restriction enzyme M protein
MAKKEAKTDLWVHGLLQEANIQLEPQGSTILELNEALKTASKSGSGKAGFPEFIGVVKDFILVIENKADVAKHERLDEKGLISTTPKAVKDFAINGALFYAKHLVKNTSYKKVIAFGISGDEKRHRITPLFIDEAQYDKKLEEVETFISFNEKNIDEYYTREILKENTDTEKELSEILEETKVLHEDLRNYGNLKDIDKPLIVSGIMLALRESEFGSFNIDNLTGDIVETDGKKIYQAITTNLQRSQVSPEVKKDKILSQFAIIRDSQVLNEINETLHKTPLKHYTQYLHENIYKSIKYSRSSEDYIGRFYGEFMSYSGGDGQTLGIILTPKHITDLFCNLVAIKADDVVFDPCSGTAGFLISAMHHMLSQAENEHQKGQIRQQQLHGIEIQSYMFTIATTNMILRGDGKSHLINGNFLKEDPNKLQTKGLTVGMMNPPYSQGSKKNPELYEIAFTEHLLNSMVKGGRVVVIVPQSALTGKSKEEATIKANILKKHTLEGVITLNKNTFYGVGTMPCIAVFTAGEPHLQGKKSKFIDFREDGYKVSPHVGLIEQPSAKDKKQHLLDVWFNRTPAENKFCVETEIESSDEWLHSFYYFNDTIPTESDFEKSIGDYLTFEFSMIMQNRGYLFENESDLTPCQNSLDKLEYKKIDSLRDKEWREFSIGEEFSIESTKSGIDKNKLVEGVGDTPYITRSDCNNGISLFVSDTQLDKYSMDLSGVITIGLDTQTVFFQPRAFFTGQNIQVLNHASLNRWTGFFLLPLLKNQMEKFNWGGNGATLSRLKKTRIMLPVDKKGSSDYKYMEQYIINLEIKKREQYINHVKDKI